MSLGREVVVSVTKYDQIAHKIWLADNDHFGHEASSDEIERLTKENSENEQTKYFTPIKKAILQILTSQIAMENQKIANRRNVGFLFKVDVALVIKKKIILDAFTEEVKKASNMDALHTALTNLENNAHDMDVLKKDLNPINRVLPGSTGCQKSLDLCRQLIDKFKSLAAKKDEINVFIQGNCLQANIQILWFLDQLTMLVKTSIDEHCNDPSIKLLSYGDLIPQCACEAVKFYTEVETDLKKMIAAVENTYANTEQPVPDEDPKGKDPIPGSSNP